MDTIFFDKNVFQIDAIKRALYRFADKCSFEIICYDNEFKVIVFTKEHYPTILDDIRNEVLDQDLRDSISKETRDLRNLILANAFSNTGLIED